MSEEQFALREMLERREREFLLSRTKVKMKSSVENLEVGDFRIERLSEGDSAELPRWVADELVGLNMAEEQGPPFDREVFLALSKEKMMGPLQLAALPRDFYLKMRRTVSALGEAVESAKAKKGELDSLRSVCYDLVGMRLSKLLALSSSSTSVTSMGDKLTPEEASFFSISQSLSKEWKTSLLGGPK